MTDTDQPAEARRIAKKVYETEFAAVEFLDDGERKIVVGAMAYAALEALRVGVEQRDDLDESLRKMAAKSDAARAEGVEQERKRWVEGLRKPIACLALELPESVHKDVAERFDRLTDDGGSE